MQTTLTCLPLTYTLSGLNYTKLINLTLIETLISGLLLRCQTKNRRPITVAQKIMFVICIVEVPDKNIDWNTYYTEDICDFPKIVGIYS
jgi:hypothetical protein